MKRFAQIVLAPLAAITPIAIVYSVSDSRAAVFLMACAVAGALTGIIAHMTGEA